MVKMQQSSDTERLETILRELCEDYGFTLDISGWTRKTYDVRYREKRLAKREHMLRVESLATTNGEIRFYNDRARDFAIELGERLEAEFGVSEATIIREQAPGNA